jgi:CubicO group peptidase (beta-lactamase class C family)
VTDQKLTTLPRSAPAEQGVDAAGIAAFVDAVASVPDVELHSLMVLRHGQVVAEAWWDPYGPREPHLLYSLSKSFTSTALGFAVGEGLVDLDATVLSYFPELDAEVTDERSRSIRVRHVASMASGHTEDTIEQAWRVGDGDILRGFLLLPPDEEPGSVFEYNQPCTFAVAAIVQRVSGVSLTEYLRPRLFEPLGIGPVGWLTDGRGREVGFSGLFAPTEAIAKLGQLYLRNGEWDGRRLLSAEWVAEASRSHVVPNRDNPDWNQGYGFQFWRSRHGYRGDGAFGQFMVILPEADAVVAITSQSPDMQAVLDAAWAHLLPALSDGAGPAAGAPAQPLTSGTLAGPVPSGPPGEFTAATYRPGAGNEVAAVTAVELRRAGSGWELAVTDSGPQLLAALGVPGTWTTTGQVATAHAWAGGRLDVDIAFVETPHRLRLSLDPATGQFGARWQTEPIHRLPLAELRMPR